MTGGFAGRRMNDVTNFDAAAKTRGLSFGRSEKSASRNFSVVTLQVATLKIAERVFFRNRDKILRRSFGSRVNFRKSEKK